MTAILQNAVTAKRVTATATDENYKYNVVYEVGDNGKTLSSVNINVTFKSNGAYAGDMSYQNKNKTLSGIPDTADASVLLAMIDGIIAEIKATLVTE